MATIMVTHRLRKVKTLFECPNDYNNFKSNFEIRQNDSYLCTTKVPSFINIILIY